MENQKKELLFSITKEDCEFEFFTSGGPGGQNTNKVATACRCTHRPSRAVAVAREHRTQGQNRKEAFKRMAQSKEFRAWLRIEIAKKTGASLEEKKPGRSSDQERRVRTYSIADHRVTDHRLGLTVHDIDKVFDGHIDIFIQGMIEKEAKS